MPDILLTVTEAAEILNVHPTTLRRWDQEGSLPAIRINDRGDRRYRKSDLQSFINSNPNLVRYTQETRHKNYSIQWDTSGFVTYPGRFAVIGQLLVQKGDEKTGFAFIASGLSLFSRENAQKALEKLALERIEGFIDDKAIFDEDIHTFEFQNEEFHEVNNPDWWQAKYGLTLCAGLRVIATSVFPATNKRLSWRITAQFKVKQGGVWLTNTFGSNNNFSEYQIFVTSGELMRAGLPNTEKGAELFAVHFMVKRFNETKDKDGDRDISRIEETRAACWDKKCVRNEVLPVEFE